MLYTFIYVEVLGVGSVGFRDRGARSRNHLWGLVWSIYMSACDFFLTFSQTQGPLWVTKSAVLEAMAPLAPAKTATRSGEAFNVLLLFIPSIS